MEYVQMTLNDWVQMKQKLKQELLGVKQSFVRIGYALRKIDDEKLYERDGYKSIAEFAKAEYGLEPYTTSRFMSINREYSVDGYSEILRLEFADLNRSQLEEMLKLPVSDRQMIQHETSREDIRDLKRFNKAEPETGVADDLKQLIEKFWREHLEILDALDHRTFTEETIKQFVELVNPSGSRSYKKGLYFLMMYENRVAVKKFGQDPQNMTWWEFYRITEELIGDLQAERAEEPATEEEPEEKVADRQQEAEEEESQRKEIAPAQKSGEHQEILEEEPIPEEEKQKGNPKENETEHKENGEATEDETSKPEGETAAEEKTERTGSDFETVKETERKENQEEEIAPAQKSAEILEREASDKVENEENHGVGKGETSEQETEAAAEVKPEGIGPGIEVMNQPEIIEKPYGSRKDYMDTLTAYGMAHYMAAEFKRQTLNFTVLESPSRLETWLLQEVDEEGREIECVN